MNRLKIIIRTLSSGKRFMSVQSSGIGLLNLQTNFTEQDIYNKVQSGKAVLSDSTDVPDHGRLHFVKTGKGEHTLLLMPGALGCAKTDFQPQIELLNKDLFTIIAWDPPGYGKSRPPDRTWPLEFFKRDADAAVKLMQKLELTPFSMLGWSDGGITGLILAATYPHLVRKCVLWGANAYITEQDMVLFEAIRDIDKWSKRMKDPFLEIYGEKYFRAQWNAWVNAYGRYVTEKDGDICKGLVQDITAPTLIIHGDKDPLVVDEHPKYLNKNIKNSRLINMPEGKHNLHLRYAEEFNAMVTDFLRAT